MTSERRHREILDALSKKPEIGLTVNPARTIGHKRVRPVSNYMDVYDTPVLSEPSDIDKVVVGGALLTVAAPLVPKCFCRCVCLA